MKRIQKFIIVLSLAFISYFLLIQSAKLYTPKPDAICFDPTFQKLIFSDDYKHARPVYKLKMLQELVLRNPDNELIQTQLRNSLPSKNWEPIPLITLKSFSSELKNTVTKDPALMRTYDDANIKHVDMQANLKIPYHLCNKSSPDYLNYEKTWPSWLIYIVSLTTGLLWIFA